MISSYLSQQLLVLAFQVVDEGGGGATLTGVLLLAGVTLGLVRISVKSSEILPNC